MSDDLRDQLRELERIRNELATRQATKEQIAKLKKEIKELEESSTTWGSVKQRAKRTFLNTRDHLREKGKKFNEAGERLSTGKNRENNTPLWDSPVARLAQETTTNTKTLKEAANSNPLSPNPALRTDYNPPVARLARGERRR